uniref:Terpene synthase N-terminal domain-containing protein n=1 Tax=Physcomitrium patens TaxID=3218 RepID=A0A2K1IW25_PHYPA|nr:hypothetical protein PHYPA_025427 [Physcomitrium patens]
MASSTLIQNHSSGGTSSLSSFQNFRGQSLRFPGASIHAAVQCLKKRLYLRATESVLQRSPGSGSYSIVTEPSGINPPSNDHLQEGSLTHKLPISSLEEKHILHFISASNHVRWLMMQYLWKLNIQSTFYAPDIWSETLQITEWLLQATEKAQMNEWIEEISNYFRNMTLGEISMSPCDTAWVARVPALDGSHSPQFPLSLQWIMDNQLSDGDWGEPSLFLGHDRVCNTLACVVALKTWEVGAQNMERDDDNHMPIGFEIVFPAMMEDAKALELDLPYDATILQQIAAEREKLKDRIPMAMLLQLQSENGSFLYSPASTACALMYTKDAKCFDYLNQLLIKFDHACPNVYPVELFERLWIVDCQQRLRISRYFEREVRQCLQYVIQYWKDCGIGRASNSTVQDVDDTAMAFRLLRTHGFDVKEDCLRQFFKDGSCDIWIDKSLYRMPAVTNKVFLKLAKADFNMCQALQKKELERVIKWNASCHFKDLDFARQKSVECYFAGPATIPLYVALFFVGQRLDEDVLDSYDYHNVMHLVNRIGRILNDIQGRKREANQGKKLCVQMYMEEHPCVPSEAMAIAHLQELVDNSMQQLTYEVLRFIAVPKSCKRIHLNMAKIMHAFYKDTDRFSSLTAMAGFVKKVLFEPVPE